MQDLIRSWPGEQVVCSYVPEHDAWIFICIHFLTGPDVGTTEADMDYLRPRCEWIFGSAGGRSGDRGISESTALGVFHGIAATVEHLDGHRRLDGLKVVVQGAGAVGAPLVGPLVAAGADVAVTDTDPDRLEHLASDAARIAPEAAVTAECDVFAPCAVGGVIGPAQVPALRCRAVAGSANNPLASPETAALLRARGILYAPDYVINAGGVLHGLGVERHGWSDAELVAQLQRIGDRLRIYTQADDAGTDPLTAAQQLFGRASAA
jgi:glutamate dehydrogenase/leucine dehydrogenase